MSLALRAAAVTDIGLVRTNNEDSVHAGRRLVAVADGIGGMPAGELASDIVIKAMARLDEGPTAGDPVGCPGRRGRRGQRADQGRMRVR